ncbi:39S ribosomal protein L10, mitochondrial isoform X2 [Sabethes cyaneus]|uniref:39S ribosomal protein L10, mitochondrial isoform X2 n=1 Tax=Sabethes cyaneus TaxID=53552 RepID=UPI00237DE1FD|nr:39S ribosomal protein L10, mitochondrial isoform X2 [Sabethes cyaneus]
MSSISLKAFLQPCNPLLSLKRFRGKINIQRPRAPHYERARVLELVKPIYKEPEFNAPCFDTKKEKLAVVENTYEKIIAREVRNWLDQSSIVAFIHLNSIKQEDFFKAQVALHRYQMSVKVYGKSIIRQAVENTKYEAIQPLFLTKTALVFGPDETKVKQLLNVLKKTPQFVLVAGIINGQFLSKNEFVNFASLPDLTTARAQLAAILSSTGAQIVSDLEGHQNQLVNVLEAFVRHEKSKTADSSSDGTENSNV